MADSADAAKWAEDLWRNDRVAGELDVEFVASSLGHTTVRMVVRDNMINGAGSCHGGVIFTLADIAFQGACNSHGRLTVSGGATIDYARPAKLGDTLVAECAERFRTKSGGTYDVTVTREADNALVAIFRGQARELVLRQNT